jgi:uncharacterized protein YdbL (DUF1318 family)
MTNAGFFSRIAVILIFLAGIFSVNAMDASQRLAIIKGLKIKGIVGENNKGLLEFRGQMQGKEVIDEENTIRKSAYQNIAAQTNSTAEKVGEQRAAQLASESPTGTWIQSVSGEWEKK